MSMPADPTTSPPSGPFSDSLNAALDEVDRITQKRDAASDALKAMPDDKDHQGQRSRAAQSLQQFENQLSIASRKVTEILRQQGQVSARPGTAGTPASPKSIPIQRTPNGVWTKDDTANPQDDGSPGWRQAKDATGTPLPGTATDRQVQDAVAQQNANTASRRVDVAGQNANTAAQNADTNATNAATRAAVGTSQIDRNNAQAQHIAALTPFQIQDLQARGVLTAAQAQAIVDKTPAEVDQMVARGDLSSAQASMVRQKMQLALAPQDVSAPVTQPNIVQRDPATGDISSVENPNYRPTDIAARVTQLQQAATAQRDKLNQQILAGKSKEDAAAEFDAWWATNIDPYAQQLTQQQQQTQFDYQTKQREQQRLESEQQRAAFSTAQQAGQDAVKNIVDTGPYRRVGPGYDAIAGNILNSFATGKAPAPIDASGLSFTLPDLNEVARQGTAAALAHISPTAASISGRPMPQIPQGFDVSSALNKAQYQPRGTTLVHPDGTVEVKPPDQPPPQPDFAAASINDPARGQSYAAPPYSPAF